MGFPVCTTVTVAKSEKIMADGNAFLHRFQHVVFLQRLAMGLVMRGERHPKVSFHSRKWHIVNEVD